MYLLIAVLAFVVGMQAAKEIASVKPDDVERLEQKSIDQSKK